MTTSSETVPDLLHHDFAAPRATVIVDQENFHKLTPGGFSGGSTGANARMLTDVTDRGTGDVLDLLRGQFRVDGQGERFF